ncbi:MAG TPA: M1 family metallopeptidase [Phenylobacterium sp.]|nr:M1 family metallopeptidase [Phenylobacterium sp.]
MALRLFTFLAAAVVAATTAHAQSAPTSTYDPLKTFAPLTLPQPATTQRTGAGTPGPSFWQNRADYNIEARIDTTTHVLSGQVTITYTNNSPDSLPSLWLQIDQNIYRPDSRATAMGGGGRPRSTFTDGYVIEAVETERGGKPVKADWLVSDTRMRVDLPQALKAGGGQVKVRIRYHYTVPGLFGGRTAWNTNKNGDIYDIAQWYPRMQVYDDQRGWDTLPYLANEFYLEYGAFDYAVTVPADMIVAGSGALTNPKDVLSSEQLARLDRARASDKTVLIRTPGEVLASTPAAPGAVKTWRFHMENTRDVAFTASRAFVWDAARINLPEGKTALAQSVYPPESVGEEAWSRSTEYMKDAVERMSKRWYPYPWPNAINVAGPATGMEYPGIVFDGIPDKAKTLFFISAHEIGHTWFPMIVGSDERRDAWMDEGFNTFIDVYESDDFANGLYGPKRDGEYAPGPEAPADQIAALLNDPEAPPIMSRADTVREKYRHPVTYFKTAFGLTLLREDILGPQRFDPAFRKYIADWAYKHPKPSDFFRAMESAGGEDLSWFWRGYFFNNWTHDLAVTDVQYVGGDPSNGAKVTVANLGQLVLPATLRVTYKTGEKREVRVPVETWMQSGSRVFAFDAGPAIADVTIDPDHRLPDRDRTNNSFKPK